MLADRTLDSVLRLHILVTEVNDNAPVFISAPRHIRITSPLAGGSLIADFRAIDRDAGQNAHITYSLREWVLEADAKGPNSTLAGAGPTARARAQNPNGILITDNTAITRGLVPFAIADNGGLITRPLNGQRADYWLEVVARDNGRPSLAAHHRFLVQLIMPSSLGLFNYVLVLWK